jgi:hypothetical protein
MCFAQRKRDYSAKFSQTSIILGKVAQIFRSFITRSAAICHGWAIAWSKKCEILPSMLVRDFNATKTDATGGAPTKPLKCDPIL